MNTAEIIRHIQAIVPSAIGLRIEEQPRGAYALHWMRDGMSRCVLFDEGGLFDGMSAAARPRKPDVLLAVELSNVVQA